MIVRAWLIAGTLLIALAWYLMVILSPDAFQGSETTAIKDYRKAGLMPAAGAIVMSKEIGHDTFERPAADAEHLKEERAAAGAAAMQAVPGMKSMPGAPAIPGTKSMPGAPAMPGTKSMPGAPAMPGSQAMPGTKTMPGTQAMPGMTGKAMTPGNSSAGDGDEEGGGGGIRVLDAKMAAGADRTIKLDMAEWRFAPGRLTVKPGQVIRLMVRNTGNTPHEFMIMTAPAMRAVRYRLQRADWNLTEHEAVYEKSLIMPGDSFEVVFKVEKPGMWMFMCMFPYHMQMGMMGMLMTEGMAAMPMTGSGKM